jgi:hypothetical protein
MGVHDAVERAFTMAWRTHLHDRSPDPGAAPAGTGREGVRRGVAVLLVINSVGIALAYWSASDRLRSVALNVPDGHLRVAVADTAERRAAGLSRRD